jgi:ADP-ribose pyrophosphatase
MSSRFERTAARTIYEGKIVTVRMDTYRHEDGEEVEREIVAHPGAVGIVAHDGESVYLIRQPREPVGSPDLLEVPAGKLDEQGESPLESAKRELAEEIGKAADDWVSLGSFFTSPGITDEEVHLFLATGLRDVDKPAVEEDERIELCVHPLADLDALIDQAHDSKTLIGLYALRRRLAS